MAKRSKNSNHTNKILDAKSVNPMGVSPDHEFSIEPLSKEAEIAKKRNTK